MAVTSVALDIDAKISSLSFCTLAIRVMANTPTISHFLSHLLSYGFHLPTAFDQRLYEPNVANTI